MTIRTISELKPEQKPIPSDLFKISRQIGEDSKAYANRKISYGDILSSMQDTIIEATRNEWNLSSLNVTNIDNRLNKFESVISVEVNDDKTNVAKFAVSPVSLGHAHKDNDITNRADVIDIVQDFSEYITPGSYIAVDNNNEILGNGTTYSDSSSQYHWHIDTGMQDSSKSEDKTISRLGPNGGVLITETGMLTIYGWLAANYEIAAQEAWVGLFGMIHVNDGNGGRVKKWQALQIQPFVIGKYSQVAQYVGFNIPVRQQLELKIMTGFKVNDSASALHVGNSLMYNSLGNTPNSFVGYVLQNVKN